MVYRASGATKKELSAEELYMPINAIFLTVDEYEKGALGKSLEP